MVGQVEKLRQQPRSTLLTEPQALLGSQLLFHDCPCSVPESSPRCPVAFSRHTPVWDHFSPRERSGPLSAQAPGLGVQSAGSGPRVPAPPCTRASPLVSLPNSPRSLFCSYRRQEALRRQLFPEAALLPGASRGPPWLCGGATGLRGEQSQGQSHGL